VVEHDGISPFGGEIPAPLSVRSHSKSQTLASSTKRAALSLMQQFEVVPELAKTKAAARQPARFSQKTGRPYQRALKPSGSSIPNCFLCQRGLSADTVGDFGEFTLVGANGGQVVWLADEIEGAEGFPDLFVAGIHGSDLGASGQSRSRRYGERTDAAADGRAEFRCLLIILQLCHQAALVDGGSYFIRVCDPARAGSDDSRGLQQRDDLCPARRVNRADE